ncbi:MAG: hypothetical protein FJ265_16320 [Planctomycetes bacterium]|nr:hypothetical protein [Planctomycetota bacterium]
MKTIPRLASLCLPVLAPMLLAQTPDHLVGLTRFTPNLRHIDHWACLPMGQCPVPMPTPIVLPPYAGGTAWDPVTSGAWVTNGLQLAKVDDHCAVQCPPMVIPMPGLNAVATGLDVVERQNRLLILDSMGLLHTFTNTCPPNPIATCNTGLAGGLPQRFTSGLAVDEGLGLVFMAYCDFTTGANSIAVSLLANPCQVLCHLTPPPCPTAFGPITGLAVNWARRILYATDGNNTMAMGYAPSPIGCVQIVSVNCCNLPVAADPLVGLAVRPGRASSMGQPCGNGACLPCPMNHRLGNDPNLGNAFFRLDLDQAPTGSLAWCLIGAAPCSVPGVLVPPLCGPVFALPVLGSLGPNPTIGIGQCSGSTSFAFPLPLNPGLAGWTLSSQCVALCVTGAIQGTAVSNCLSFVLQGN